MQEKTTLARPYAQAVFAQAREEGDLAAWSDMLNLINMVISDPQMGVVLDNPTLDSAFRAEFVLDICGDHLSTSGKNFVKVLADAGRLSLAPQIYQLYQQQRTEAEGVLEVEVVSAYPLDGAEEEKIAAAMAKRFGKQINISSRVDESLIGGSVIRAGDSVIDASVRGRLKQLGNELAE